MKYVIEFKDLVEAISYLHGSVVSTDTKPVINLDALIVRGSREIFQKVFGFEPHRDVNPYYVERFISDIYEFEKVSSLSKILGHPQVMFMSEKFPPYRFDGCEHIEFPVYGWKHNVLGLDIIVINGMKCKTFVYCVNEQYRNNPLNQSHEIRLEVFCEFIRTVLANKPIDVLKEIYRQARHIGDYDILRVAW